MIAVIEWLGNLAEIRDDVTGMHNERVQKYLKILIDEAKKRNLPITWKDEDVISAAALHDLGKIKIPDNILLKTSRLNSREFDEMKKHCLYGKMLIEDLQKRLPENGYIFLEHAKKIAYCHHEKWDGTGYPEGLKGNEIPLEARMLSLVDVYDVLMTKRPYKAPLTQEVVVEMVLDGKGSHFDPSLVDMFLGAMGALP